MHRALVLLAALALAAVAAPAPAAEAVPPPATGVGEPGGTDQRPAGEVFPDRIPLPDGFFPEGIVIDGLDAYVGSLADGSVVRQDLRRGITEPFVDAPGPGRIAVGLDVDRHGRLWVAGGGPFLDPTVAAGFRVYDTRTGELLVEQTVPAGFVNDVVVTRDAAWFTDSFRAQLVRVPLGADGTIGEPEPVPLGGDWVQVPGEFGANGILATGGGRTLVVGQTVAPDDPRAVALYRVPASPGDDGSLGAQRIALDDPVVDGDPLVLDGLVLVGRTLYAVAGSTGVVTLRLSGDLRSGAVTDVLEVPGGVTPTTADVLGPRLYVVDPLAGTPGLPFFTVAIRR